MADFLAPPPEGQQRVPLVVHEATRTLLWLRAPREARQTAVDLVHALGGEVVNTNCPDPGVVPVDISFGEGESLFPLATSDQARELLDQYLTPFVLDARRVIDLAGQAERLAESASIDALTGLLNRRMLDRALGRLRPGETIVIADLDHFKRVNDELGHRAGDDVLRVFGAVLRDVLRGRDVVGRYGGEEFVFVIAPPSDAETVLDRLRSEWSSRRPTSVTFSAGIARFAGDANTTLQLADEALYRAKDTGRDRWIVADSPPQPQHHHHQQHRHHQHLQSAPTTLSTDSRGDLAGSSPAMGDCYGDEQMAPHA